MAYPVAAGVPNVSGNYIPEIYSKMFLAKFYTSSVAWDICNTDYEKEVTTQGESVVIRQVPTFTISDHVAGAKINHETPTADPITFPVDKGKEFSFAIPKVIEQQSGNIMGSNFMSGALEDLKVAIDRDILQGIYASASSDNCGTTAGKIANSLDLGTSGAPEVITKTNIVDYLGMLSQVLDEQNVPQEGRWVVLPSAAKTIFMSSDLNNASLTGDGKSIFLNGKINDNYAGFKIYISNNLKTASDGGTCYYIPAGHPKALAMATTITENRIMESADYWGKFYQALQIYGYKVVKDDAFAILYARFAIQ